MPSKDSKKCCINGGCETGKKGAIRATKMDETFSFISKENKTKYYLTYIMGGDGGLCPS